jgi:hypothetical protein
VSVLALNVELVPMSSTPLGLLTIVLFLSAMGCGGVLLAMFGVSGWLDRVAPPRALPTPAEWLWSTGGMGRVVERQFAGLDSVLARDLATQIAPVEVAKGGLIVEQGAPSNWFFVVKTGTARSLPRIGRQLGRQAEESDTAGQEYKAGDAIGEDTMLSGAPWPNSVEATSDCQLLRLSLDDYLAATALASLRGSVAQPSPERELDPDEASEPAVAREDFVPTHRAPVEGLAAWTEPTANAPLARRLGPFETVRLSERVGGWTNVERADGSTVWVDGAQLTVL